MLEKAQKTNNVYHMAFALQAAGSIASYSNMPTEATESYLEALTIFEKTNETGSFKKLLLIKLIYALFQVNETEKASAYLQQADTLIGENESDPLYPFFTIYKANFYTASNQLEEALSSLGKVQSFIKKINNKEDLLIVSYHYALGSYYEKAGNYKKSLHEYEQIPIETARKLDPNRYTILTISKANVLEKMGREKEACSLLQEMNDIKDTLNMRSYKRQINNLRASYRVNQWDIDNQIKKNQINRWIIFYSIILLAFLILFIFYILKSNKRLAESKLKEEEAKKNAEKSIQSKSMFISNMSHEIRTPLNALTGFSTLLTEDTIDNETHKQCHEIIQQNSHLLLQLINEVIDLTHIEFGNMQFYLKETNAVTICKNVVEMVQRTTQTSADIYFKTNLNSLLLHTDEARLQQVLINILVNATKFTPSGQIILELTQGRDIALFTVSDTGCGIPQEKQEQIFNRFEKLDELKPGTGLGLSICQLIIKQIGGEIWIDSSYNKGTRFCFTHPLNIPLRNHEN
ncbi:MAG: ATP-binding protein [Bacteroides sp.]|nr:ATP-binding protein [Bacteroides sp.]